MLFVWFTKEKLSIGLTKVHGSLNLLLVHSSPKHMNHNTDSEDFLLSILNSMFYILSQVVKLVLLAMDLLTRYLT